MALIKKVVNCFWSYPRSIIHGIFHCKFKISTKGVAFSADLGEANEANRFHILKTCNILMVETMREFLFDMRRCFDWFLVGLIDWLSLVTAMYPLYSLPRAANIQGKICSQTKSCSSVKIHKSSKIPTIWNSFYTST